MSQSLRPGRECRMARDFTLIGHRRLRLDLLRLRKITTSLHSGKVSEPETAHKRMLRFPWPLHIETQTVGLEPSLGCNVQAS